MEENGVFVYKCNSIREGAGGTGYQPLFIHNGNKEKEFFIAFLPMLFCCANYVAMCNEKVIILSITKEIGYAIIGYGTSYMSL